MPLTLCYIFADINDLNLPKTCTTEFPDPDDLLTFKLIICPDEGFYKGGRFKFSFKVSCNRIHDKIDGSFEIHKLYSYMREKLCLVLMWRNVSNKNSFNIIL